MARRECPSVVSERWVPIAGYGEEYEVSSLGRVRSKGRTIPYRDGRVRTYPGVVLSQSWSSRGYLVVGISHRGNVRAHTVHSLVATAFHGPKPDGLECRHLNGNKSDNSASNLRWGTRAENREDMIRHGTDPKKKQITCIRGHLLEEPNLRLSPLERGLRECRSCAAARAYVTRHPSHDLQEESDRYYKKFQPVVQEDGSRRITLRRK